jgi:GntR family transcriptional regulator/MocR family aminotransferase
MPEPLVGESRQPLARLDRAGSPLNALRAAGVSLAPAGGAELSSRLRAAIVEGRLADGAKLPSARVLAATLGLSRNAVAACYASLADEHLITARHGSGTYVAQPADAKARGRPHVRADVEWLRGAPPGVPVAPGTSDIDLRLRAGTIAPIATDAWRRAWRHATATVAQTYGDPQGPREVREAIAEHVRSTRGVACVAADVVVTSGASDALALLLRATMSPSDVLAAENPGYRGVTRLAAVHAIPLLALPVDANGARVRVLAAADPQPLAVHVTPSHQFPTGVELSPERRGDLLAWAERRGALVIENDYDGEFRFDGEVAPPLAAVDTSGVVCLVGTFSRLLTPSLRVGYAVATPALVERVAALKRMLDEHASLPAQHAVAQLIRSGELGRHLRRVRRLATYKRALVREALGAIDGVALHGVAGGLHVLIDGPERPAEIAARLRARGVHLDLLADHCWAPADHDGLLLDYGRVEPSALERALTLIAAELG